MTLAAELWSLLFEQVWFFGTVPIVARIAITIGNRCMGVGLEKLGLFFRMAGVADYVHSVPEKRCEVGAMGIVAVTA